MNPVVRAATLLLMASTLAFAAGDDARLTGDASATGAAGQVAGTHEFQFARMVYLDYSGARGFGRGCETGQHHDGGGDETKVEKRLVARGDVEYIWLCCTDQIGKIGRCFHPVIPGRKAGDVVASIRAGVCGENDPRVRFRRGDRGVAHCNGFACASSAIAIGINEGDAAQGGQRIDARVTGRVIVAPG